MADTAGGFMKPSVPSPPPSYTTSSTSHLPQQRTHPLKAGSMKETTVINHLDQSILGINRRHAKKFSSSYEVGEGVEGEGESERESERGYEGFGEVVRDVERLVDVLWVSGTPSLQIPYMISLAVLVNSCLPDYPFSPRATFLLLHKLDSVFASLLLGEDVDAGPGGTPLPGFETRRNVVSMTEKVRIKSIAEACRMVVMEVRERGDDDDGMDGGDSSDDDEDMVDVLGNGNDGYREMPGRWEMEAARVYERTIQILGDELGKQGEFGVDIADDGGCG